MEISGYRSRVAGYALLALLAAPAYAADSLRITYDAAGAPVTFERDSAGTVQVDGLPYPGLVLYKPETGVVYYQHPSLPQWLAVAPGVAAGVSATLTRGPAWQKWQSQSARRFDLKTEAAGTGCGNLFASPGVGAQAGLTLTDIWRVLTTVAWLNAGKAVPECERLLVTPAQGRAVGLPVHLAGPNGDWQLQEMARTPIAKIALPTAAEPISEQTRLDLLLRQFAPDERKGFVRDYGNLPTGQQLELLEQALAGSGAP